MLFNLPCSLCEKKVGEITLFLVQSHKQSCSSAIQKWLWKPRSYAWAFVFLWSRVSKIPGSFYLFVEGCQSTVLTVTVQLLLAGLSYVWLRVISVLLKDRLEIKSASLWEEFIWFSLFRNKSGIAEENISRAVLILLLSESGIVGNIRKLLGCVEMMSGKPRLSLN